jgi:hypothetical protein
MPLAAIQLPSVLTKMHIQGARMVVTTAATNGNQSKKRREDACDERTRPRGERHPGPADEAVCESERSSQTSGGGWRQLPVYGDKRSEADECRNGQPR